MSFRRVAVVAALCVASAAAALACPAHARMPRIDPIPRPDAADTGGGLDVTTATFGQREARLVLWVQARSAFSVSDLDPARGRTLCLELYYRPLGTLRSRICVVARDGAAALELQTLDAAGEVTASRVIDTPVKRPDERTVEASFTAPDADLPRETVGWRLTSAWIDGTCPAVGPCVDHVPDQGLLPETIRLVSGPRCLGAASRDPSRPCVNPSLRLTVYPRHAQASKIRNAYCHKLAREGLMSFCAFGVAPSRAATTVALLGDSHAAHWRGALEVVAQSRRWYGLTMIRSGCPLTRARPILPSTKETRQCWTWNDQVQAWLRRHPEVSTVIVAAHRGKTRRSALAGYQRAWRMMPPTVKRILVIRGAPVSHVSARCIRRAVKRRKRPGVACAEHRRTSIRRDPEADAARSFGSARVRVVDMTRYFCSRRVCYPVIGGVLVHKDGVHLTRIFTATLGPLMLRSINRLL